MDQDHDLKPRKPRKLRTGSSPVPVPGGPGSHPVGSGVGAAGGASAGTATGTTASGAVGGGAIGVATGGPVGEGAAQTINPTAEDEYWNANYLTRDYVEQKRPYADYRPAYRYGWESRGRLGNRSFRSVESDLERGWDVARGECKLDWSQARRAVSDAWHRLEGATPVDATRSGP